VYTFVKQANTFVKLKLSTCF